MVIDRDRLTQLCNDIPASHQPLSKLFQTAAHSTISNPSLSLQKSKIALGIIVRDVYEKEMHKQVSNISVRILLNNKNFIAKIHPRRIYPALTGSNLSVPKAKRQVQDSHLKA